MTAPSDPTAARLIGPDGSVTIPPEVAGEVLRALIRDLTARVRADGGEVTPAVRHVLYALHEAAQRPAPPAPSSADGTPPEPPATVELTAYEAAALMGCSTEYVRRLARSGRVLARRAGTAWLINPQSLDTYRKGRAA